MLKIWIHSITTRNYAVTYYQILDEVPWHLRLIKLEKFKKMTKMEKIVKISIKLRVLASGCSSVAGHRGGLHHGLMGAGATVGWGQQRGGGLVQQWGVFNQ